MKKLPSGTISIPIASILFIIDVLFSLDQNNQAEILYGACLVWIATIFFVRFPMIGGCLLLLCIIVAATPNGIVETATISLMGSFVLFWYSTNGYYANVAVGVVSLLSYAYLDSETMSSAAISIVIMVIVPLCTGLYIRRLRMANIELIRQITTAREDLIYDMSSRLHDSALRYMTRVLLQLKTIESEMDSNAQYRNRLSLAIENCSASIKQLREVLSSNDQSGIAVDVRDLIESYRKLMLTKGIKLQIEGQLPQNGWTLPITIISEALENAYKYAKWFSKVVIQFKEEHDILYLQVSSRIGGSKAGQAEFGSLACGFGLKRLEDIVRLSGGRFNYNIKGQEWFVSACLREPGEFDEC